MTKNLDKIQMAAHLPSKYMKGVAELLAPVARPVEMISKSYAKVALSLKITLPLCALCLLCLIAIWPMLTRAPRAFVSGIEAQSQIVRPRLVGSDKNKNPFQFSAKKAVQLSADGIMIGLTEPGARLLTKEAIPVAINSKSGYYDKSKAELVLTDGVSLNHNGHEFKAEKVVIQSNLGTAWSTSNVTGDGERLKLNAKGFRLSKDGVLVLTGPARVVLKEAAFDKGKV